MSNSAMVDQKGRLKIPASLLPSRAQGVRHRILHHQRTADLARFDDFIEIFNNERPHEALDMKCPAAVYQPSTRTYQGLPDIDYPFHDKIIVVTNCGRTCLGHKKFNFSTVFAGQAVGIKEVHDDIWLVSLGFTRGSLGSLQ